MSGTTVGEIVARLSLESSQFSAGVSQAESQMNQMSNSAKSLSTQMGIVQTAALAVGGAVVAGIGVSVKTAADFEQAMSKVQSISGATGQDFEALRKVAMDLGESTKFTATEAAQGLQYLAMAGFSVKDQIGSLPAVLNMAAAASVDMGTSADIVSNIMTGFGIASEDSTYAVDVLVKTMTSANTDLLQLGDAMKYVAPVATSLGFTFEETAAAVAKMSDAGIQGSMAGTALRAGMLRLANPIGRAAKATKAYGIEVQDASGKMKPLPEIIGHLNEKLGHLGQAQKTAAIASLVGTEAASGFAALLATGEKSLKSYTKSLEESAGTAQSVADVQMDNLYGAFEKFTSALEGVGIKLGNEFLPHLRSIVDHGTKLVDLFSKVNPSVVATGLAMAGTSAAIALTAASAVKLGFALRGLFAAMGPAGWIITGLSLLGGLLVGVSAGYKAMNTVSLEAANAKQKEVDGINKTIKEYDGLQAKMKLTNDELLRYLDNKDALANEKDSAAIKKLNAEQDGLRKSSGLTNEEFDRFLQLNDQIIKKSPETEAAFSAQGNAIAKNTEAMKRLSAEKAEELRLELEKQKTISERNMEGHLQKEKQLKQEINSEASKRAEKEQAVTNQLATVESIERKIAEAKKNGNQAEAQMHQVTLAQEKQILDTKRNELIKSTEILQKKQASLAETQKEIGKLTQVNQKLIDLELRQVGLTAKKGQGVAVLDKELGKLNEARWKLINNTTAADKKTAEYRKSLAAIEKEITQLEQTRSKVVEITGQASVMNAELSKDLSKRITIITTDVTRKTERAVSRGRGNEGTYHVGGIVGKPAGKLHSGGMASKFIDRPMSHEVDIRALRNEMVLTEAQQSNLFRMLDAGHTARVASVGGYSPQMQAGLSNLANAVESLKGLSVVMEGEVVGRIVEPHVSRRQMDEIDRSSY
ncbi:phage tail tape measure protein [Bacillus pumilus]|uniref:phage tail tape measure protein n=1 Tax=Bacillus pumilus TaxID=1408 RepID=UPI00017A5EE3|nr:phage tail tape measure protein [Bacillus pumilus]EDW22550.1 phage tail tape measure protein, family, core region [Bacillus pumilus ATCC 7061]MCR4352148.1 phage tail tape measure protein [Bacillus pumilus]MCY7503959.1 phage tail tape measure protein [Bacillus pumilus]MDR4269048.1 phage tail tape measure protein [Bacillus pumilus]MDR4269135.1 phage tail tape measure protein [Bacillus pumilus]